MANTAVPDSRYHKLLDGRAETDPRRASFEEPYESSLIIAGNNVWKDAHHLPADPASVFESAIETFLPDGIAKKLTLDTSPPTDPLNAHTYRYSRIVERYEKILLKPVAGTTRAFYSEDLKNCIINPGNLQYSISIFSSDGLTPIKFPVAMVNVDSAAGMLTFYCEDAILHKSSLSSISPPRVDFYKYIGNQTTWTDELLLTDPTNYTTANVSIKGSVTTNYILPDVVETRPESIRRTGTVLLEENLEDTLQYCVIDANNAKDSKWN